MEEAVRLDPERGATYTQLGLVELARGKREEAEAALKKAVSLDPKSVSSQLALGHFYWSVGRQAETERAFEAALQIDPKNIGANRAMALLSLSTGRMDEAEKYLKQVADTRRPGGAVCIVGLLCRVRSREGCDRAADAAGDGHGPRCRCQATVWRQPWRPLETAPVPTVCSTRSSRRIRVTSRRNSRRGNCCWRMARATRRWRVSKRPLPPTRLRCRRSSLFGRVYATGGDIAGAEKAFQEVVKLNPRVAAAHVELSRLQLVAARPQDSLASAEAAVEDQPQSLEVRLALVRSLIVGKKFARPSVRFSRC